MSKEPNVPQKFIVVNERKPTWKIAVRIAFLYFIFGMLWILLSDKAVSLLVTDANVRMMISITKGSLFVVISAFLIYTLIAPVLSKLSDSEQVVSENRNELKAMLYYDHLTGLSNRRKLLERLPEYLTDGTETGKALIYIDVDNIKLINDTLGHVYGDTLIASIACRILNALPAQDELYRLGGDEFIILTQFSSLGEIETLTERILKLFEVPLPVDKLLLHSTISLGVALSPLHSRDSGELLKCADIAMYQSKKNGKNRAVLYDVSMMAAINERMTIGEHLHDALVKNELEVFYQPQINTKTRKIASFEALLRWTNPVLGRVSPDNFISVAEETHLIIPIGEWVLTEACRFLKKMHTAGYPELSMSVNISMIQILQENFVTVVERILSDTGIDPHKMELEITESILMESYTVIGKHLEELRALGIGIALDDFGKGYSSLSYLEQLPITVLKIDKIFIDGITAADQDTSITGNIVRIGKKLGLVVIAEGVETEPQLAYLSFQQCDKIQGWIFSKALNAAEAKAYTIENLTKSGN